MRKHLLPLLLAAILLTACACAKAPVQAAEPQTPAATDVPAQTDAPAGETVPAESAAPANTADAGAYDGLAFSLAELTTGETIDDSYFRDHKLTMVNFWATWCGPCVGEIPDLQTLSADYADKGFAILGVLLWDDDLEGAKSFLAAQGVTYPVVVAADAFETLSSDFAGIPTTMFFDAAGKQVGETILGSDSYDGWRACIDGLLEQQG